MNKRSLILGLALGLILGLFFGATYQRTELNELNQQIKDLKKENQDLNLWLLENITFYKAKIDNLEDEIKQAAGELNLLRSRFESLQSRANITVLGIYFSPKGGCESQVIEWIRRANRSIHILIYSFTLDSISDTLIEAHSRGVEVEVVFEKNQITKYSEYQKLRAAGISVRNDTNSGDMHDKVMIIDGVIVLTGSFNWSAKAEGRNNENLIIIRSIYVANVYEEEFHRIWNSSI